MIAALIMLTMLPGAADPACDIAPNALQADYRIEVSERDIASRKMAMTLWRDGNKVAHQYPQTQITEEWTLVRNSLIKPTRYFDEHQRAIEYQPGESIHGRVESDWSYRYQLVSDSFLNGLEKTAESGTGCHRKQTFEKESDGGKVKLTWLPALSLVETFSVTQGNMNKQWTLTSVAHEKESITTFFAARSDYKSTDYADIGDDHTDPFLTNMVNQGFIEAGASGFYNEHGQALRGGHTH